MKIDIKKPNYSVLNKDTIKRSIDSKDFYSLDKAAYIEFNIVLANGTAIASDFGIYFTALSLIEFIEHIFVGESSTLNISDSPPYLGYRQISAYNSILYLNSYGDISIEEEIKKSDLIESLEKAILLLKHIFDDFEEGYSEKFSMLLEFGGRIARI